MVVSDGLDSVYLVILANWTNDDKCQLENVPADKTS